MRTIAAVVETGSRAVAYLLGSFVIVLAGVLLLSRTTIEEAAAWSFQVNGITFTGLLIALILAAVYCWLQLRGRHRDDPAAPKWLEAGIQAANGITTIALTFTLLGVSLGLSSLAGQRLTPETMPAVIHDLTGTFALAFLTTVVGQPIAALLRTVLMVTHAINQGRAGAAPAERAAPPPAETPAETPAAAEAAAPAKAPIEPPLPALAEPPGPAPERDQIAVPAAAAPEPKPEPSTAPEPERLAEASPGPDRGPETEADEEPLPPPPPPREPPSAASLPIMVYAGERA